MELDENLKPICHIFFNLARSEKKVEIIKEMLCQWEEFEPYSAFKRLDRSNRNAINAMDIQRFLQENKLIYEDSIIQNTFIKHYDRDFDEKLNYSE